MIVIPDRIKNKICKLCSLKNIPEHMHLPVANYVLYSRAPGGFLKAVIVSDLFSAFSKADLPNTRAMENYVKLFYNYLPSSCYGNEEAYKWYKEKGGLVGIYTSSIEHNTDEELSKEELQNHVEKRVETWINGQLQMLQ